MSWEQLRSIERQNREWQRYWASQPPRACPNDGTPLEPGDLGVLHCPHDGWQYPDDYDVTTQAGL